MTFAWAYADEVTVPAEVLDLVLGLPDEVQDELVRELAARRQGTSDRLHPDWSAEVSTRVEDVVAGRVRTIPWSEVRSEITGRRDARGA